MNIAYLLTGGNIGHRRQNLENAKNKIESVCGEVLLASEIYETQAWGIKNQNTFYNQALKVNTRLAAEKLLKCILEIEKKAGRERILKYGPRIIDIDILLFSNEIISIKGLNIPHPELQNRRFALQCLNDIASHEIHPVLNKTISQLLKECSDPLEVKRITG